MVPVALASCVSLIALLLLSSSYCGLSTAAEPESYIRQFGTYSAAADRLATLIGAEEPLQPADLAKLTSEVRRVCTAGNPSSAKYQLAVSDLVSAYGQGETQVLDHRAVEQACSAIMACQLDDTCTLADPAAAPSPVPVRGELRLAAALFLFVEGLLGVYIPVLLKSVQGYEWWLSLLNCFSGGVFLAAGLVHLLPHCAEAQARLGPWLGDYPLYLVLITLGYMLVLFVERVLFDVHGSEHGHGPHTGIAPPCVDCRTAEEAMGPTSSSGDLAGEMGGNREDLNGVVTATGAAPLTPSTAATRYNLRSRAAASGTPASTAATMGALRKPLLADDGAAAVAAADAARQTATSSPCSHGGHHHGGHAAEHEQHVHDGHGHHVHHGHGHGHVAPLHHHAVVPGDLRQGVVLLVAMVVHTFLECMALGLMDIRSEFLMLFLAIASHKLISGLALSSRFLKDGATTAQITMYVGPFTLVAPTAIAVGMFVKDVNPMVHLALSCFATGTFLYVGASEIVEEEFEGDMRSGRTDISQVFARWCKFFMLLLGVASIALLSMIPDAHDHAHNGHAVGGGHHIHTADHHHHH